LHITSEESLGDKVDSNGLQMVPHSSEFRHEKRSSDGNYDKIVKETRDRKNSDAISEVMSEENTRKALDKNVRSSVAI